MRPRLVAGRPALAGNARYGDATEHPYPVPATAFQAGRWCVIIGLTLHSRQPQEAPILGGYDALGCYQT